MIDLKQELRDELSRIEPPDLWERIQADAARSADVATPSTPTDEDEPAVEEHRDHRWALVAAAVIVVAGAVGLIAVSADDDPKAVDTVTVTPTPVIEIRNGVIVFAADPAGGDALTSPLDHRTAEETPQPMDLYVTRDGEATRRITSTATIERCPTFSPDGKRLAYLEAPEREDAGASVAPSLVVIGMNEAGEPGPTELRVPLPASYRYGMERGGPTVPCPEWSPDGSGIAYLRVSDAPDTTSAPTDGDNLHVVTLDGRDRIVNAGKSWSGRGTFAWSPQGDAIAYPAHDGVWVAPLDGGAPSLVLRTDTTPIWDPSVVPTAPPRTMPTAVTWSARGELAVTVLTSKLENAHQSRDGSWSASTSGESAVHVVDVATGAEQTLHATVEDSRAAWSPDGSRLASLLPDRRIVVSDRDDGSTVTLSPHLDDGSELQFSEVAWSPDGTRLLARTFHAGRGPGSALVSIAPDGASAVVLTPWSWAFEWTQVDDMSWQPITD